MGGNASDANRRARKLLRKLNSVLRRKRECDGDEACLASQNLLEKNHRRSLRKLIRSLQAELAKALEVRKTEKRKGGFFKKKKKDAFASSGHKEQVEEAGCFKAEAAQAVKAPVKDSLVSDRGVSIEIWEEAKRA